MSKGRIDTGEGKVLIDLGGPDTILSPWEFLLIKLYNFNVDGDELKDEHKKCLDEEIVPLLKKALRAMVNGTASKSGDKAANRELSKWRAISVRDYLIKKKGISPGSLPLDELRGLGADKSTSKIAEDEEDRAVEVSLFPAKKPTLWPNPKPKPPAPPPEPKLNPLPDWDGMTVVVDCAPFPEKPKEPDISLSDSFEIRFLGGEEISMGIGIMSCFFDIYDLTHNASAIYKYRANTIGVGTPASKTYASPVPKKFTTSKPIRVTQFGGPAQFTTLGTGPASFNLLTMEPGAGISPITISIETGLTLGGGLSSSLFGAMELYSGPKIGKNPFDDGGA